MKKFYMTLVAMLCGVAAFAQNTSKMPANVAYYEQNLNLTQIFMASIFLGSSGAVMDLSVVKVEVGVSEQVLNTIKIGDKVDVTMTAVSELPLEGTVSTVSPAAGQTGMYTVKVELDNADGIIKAGMMAEVNFTAEKAEDTIVLPRNAVITKEDETYVYVVKGGTAKKVMVELGIEAEDTIEITKGLKKGDDVVTKGQTYISDGEEVNVVNADAKTKDKADKKEEKGE